MLSGKIGNLSCFICPLTVDLSKRLIWINPSNKSGLIIIIYSTHDKLMGQIRVYLIFFLFLFNLYIFNFYF